MRHRASPLSHGRLPYSSHLLVLSTRKEAETTTEGEEGLSGAHVQRLPILAQQKGGVVGNVLSFKPEDWPLLRA